MGDELLLLEAVSLQEAVVDEKTGKLTLTVIQSGLNASETRIYPAATLERDHKMFEGSKMFLNHQTMFEEFERPEGDLRDWMANLDETWWDAASGQIKGKATVIDPAFNEKLKMLEERGDLQDMGVSIRARGKGENVKTEGADGKTITALRVDEFVFVKSVDFVTYPGAGGQVELFESDILGLLTADIIRRKRPDIAQELNEGGGNVGDLKDHLQQMTVQELQEARPDLIEALTPAPDNDVIKLRDEQIEGLRKQLSDSTSQATVLQERATNAETSLKETRTKLEDAEAKDRKELVAEKVDEALKTLQLPKAVEKRIRAQFAGAESAEGLVEVIRRERDYIRELRGSGEVHDLGPVSEGMDEITGTEESLEEVFEGLLGSKEAAKTAAEGRV